MQVFGTLAGGVGGGGGIGGGAFGIGQAAGFGGFFADGGTLGAGKWGIAGENGPEIISGPARVTPGTGGSTSVVINVDGSSNAQGDDPDRAAKLARMIEKSTLAVITRERRPGGLLN